MITILLAEDHQIVREGLAQLLNDEIDFSVVAQVGDGLEAVRKAERLEPDVMIVDLTMPGLNGLEVIRQVHSRRPNTRLIVLSMHANEDYIVEALRNGAQGYVLKDSSVKDLVTAVRTVLNGRRFLTPSLPQEVVETYKRKPASEIEDRYDLLTSREREVLQLVAEGHTSPEIADRLFISPRTVEKHRANLMGKLGFHNQAEVVRYALQRGLIPMGGTSDSTEDAESC